MSFDQINLALTSEDELKQAGEKRIPITSDADLERLNLLYPM